MNKPVLEYVISACAQGIFPNVKLDKLPQKDEVKVGLLHLADIMHKSMALKCTQYTPKLSALYNAYTEEQHLDALKFYNNLGLDSVYSDSGGLQIVTAGKQVTSEIKAKIYQLQSYADYAMCFDIISLKSVTKKRTRNERSNVGNKLFIQDDHLAAGRATGLNIKEQIRAFRELGAKTKVVIIVQGNDKDDMVAFYNEIEKVLDKDDWNYISGIAVADTCIGNGQLESVEMLRAAHAIALNAPDCVSNHLHILGVGSISRMAPVIYLIRSGYLDKFKYISYDSSSHTSTFTYGLLKLNGTCTRLGDVRNHKTSEHFTNVYEMFEPYLKNIVTKDVLLDILFGPGSEKWSYATVKNRAIKSGKNNHIVMAHLIKAIHTYFQIDNFMWNLDQVFLDKKTYGIELMSLLNVKTEEDMIKWIRAQKGSNNISSKRITREEDHATLDRFYK
jgi:hypothetical protein